MFKRIIIGILSIVLAGTLLCGCSFFSHDTERDMKQVVAYVESYEIENSVRHDEEASDDAQASAGTSVVTYRTEAKSIYKRDLVEYYNSNASNLSSTYGSDIEAMYKYCLRMLVNTELVINEVDALIDAGIIKWGVAQENEVKKRIYSIIDSTLMSIKNEILNERNQPGITTEGDSDVNTDTTYPVKPDEENDEEEDDDFEPEAWEPSLSRYPGLSGDSDKQSLEREAMRRFISLIKDRVEGDFRVTSEDREKFDRDIENIDNIIDTRGISYVYPMIGTTHLMYYVSGKSIERSQKIRELQTYLSDSATVSDEEVIKSYNTTLNEQRSAYTSNVSAFDSAMSNNSTVLFYPNDNYFYVKHILLPFSDEQKADLSAYKARLNVSKADVEAYRERLAESIVCYPHVAGENDLSRPMTVDQVLNNIKSVMTPLESNVKSADTAFDDLIYLYNTDTGAFGNNKGYVVKYRLDSGESETYMQEFADAARYMRENLEVGQVYDQKVITDYGVHIMYFASTTRSGTVALRSYTTPGQVETYYDVLKKPIKSAREEAAYDTWERNVLTYNYNNYATLYLSRCKNLWED